MILHVNYEELRALKVGARIVLGQERAVGEGAVMAPPESRAMVEALAPRLDGDLSVASLHDLRRVRGAVVAIVTSLRAEMEAAVLATHPAEESAVAAYFDFAHGLTVAHRLQEMEAEMEAMIELVTGSPPSADALRTFRFPD